MHKDLGMKTAKCPNVTVCDGNRNCNQSVWEVKVESACVV